MFGGPARAVELPRVQRAAEPVRAEDVEAPVAHERRHAGHRVEHVLHARPDPLLRAPASARRRGLRCAREVEQVRPLRLVELQRAGECLEHRLGDAARVAALEPGVVVDADSGEQRDLLAAKPGHAPRAAAVRAQARLLGRDPGAPRGQELADLGPGVHVVEGNALARR